VLDGHRWSSDPSSSGPVRPAANSQTLGTPLK
jgi:hypothetical protein